MRHAFHRAVPVLLATEERIRCPSRWAVAALAVAHLRSPHASQTGHPCPSMSPGLAIEVTDPGSPSSRLRVRNYQVSWSEPVTVWGIRHGGIYIYSGPLPPHRGLVPRVLLRFTFQARWHLEVCLPCLLPYISLTKPRLPARPLDRHPHNGITLRSRSTPILPARHRPTKQSSLSRHCRLDFSKDDRLQASASV
jgi:hypothetical protein